MKKLELFKKGTAFCITCAIIFSSASVYATDAQTPAEVTNQDGIRKTEILFRDIPWYSTKKDVEEDFFPDGAEAAGWMSNRNEIYWTDEDDFFGDSMLPKYMDQAGVHGWYSNITVAGYTPSSTMACYIYPVTDGTIIRSDDDAQLYVAWYSFYGDDFLDYDAIFKDLKGKLDLLYGESYDSSGSIYVQQSWKDEQGNEIKLCTDEKQDFVTLTYVAGGSVDKLTEMQNCLEQEKKTLEEEERAKNIANTDGL